MEALEAIAARVSGRDFTDRPVARDLLEKLVDAGRMAPTARNEQPWEFVVITDEGRRRVLGEMTDNGRFIAEAPACIAVLCKPTKYYLEDGCAATQNILIAAAALGLQSCWVAGDKKPYAEAVARLLGAPDGLKLVALVPVGWARSSVTRPPRRELSSVLHWERL